ncbi:hypothetical protein [Aquirhabdus sp.]|uniref:hypothetical protein n=1 Tax=Aquirhabdus sp. TaxID=2824160 RepID=UPI00396CB826
MTSIKFNVTALGAGGAFRECMMFCYYGIKSLGYTATWIDEYIDPDAINIVFGAGASNWTTLSAQAKDIIIYNMEQVSPEVPWFDLAYFRQFLNTQVWDYNLKNIQALQHAGVYNIQHVQLGYCPEMTEISPTTHRLLSATQHDDELMIEQDIDVLFYGSISPRRKKTLDAIRARGLTVMSTETGQFLGDKRAEYIGRAKVVINIHYYETVGIFEIVRVSYLLANHKAVVSELSPHTDIEPDIKDAILSGSLDELPELCWQLVHDHDRRKALEERGFEAFSKRQAAEILRPAIENYLAQQEIKETIPTLAALPRTLQIGAGLRWRFDMCNIDARADFSPDLTLDISYPLPFDLPLTSWRFGQISLMRGYFNKIVAKDVFQCVNHFIQALTNCLELLEEDGTLELEVPHDLSYGVWGLADTKRTFNEHTWGKLLNNWWQYGWQTHRFEAISQSFICTNDVGFKALQEHNHNWDVVLKMPRAVDALSIVLRKRALTTDEIKHLPIHKFMS